MIPKIRFFLFILKNNGLKCSFFKMNNISIKNELFKRIYIIVHIAQEKLHFAAKNSLIMTNCPKKLPKTQENI